MPRPASGKTLVLSRRGKQQKSTNEQCNFLNVKDEIISHSVWLYFRFALSFRDVEEILAMRGVVLTYETVREWSAVRIFWGQASLAVSPSHVDNRSRRHHASAIACVHHAFFCYT